MSEKQEQMNRISFFLNGLINNFVYVIFLSAALDLVGDKLPKSTVLIFDILPAFLVKLVMPLYMHHMSYNLRIIIVILSSISALYMVGFSTDLSIQFLGIVIASAGSGLGEITFLAMSSFYSPEVIHYWASGTGAAGLVGSFIYLLFSTWLNLKPWLTMVLCSTLPLFQIVLYFKIMDHPFKNVEIQRTSGFTPLVGQSTDVIRPEQMALKERCSLVVQLIPTYMLPLFLVFFLEYTINQGISPTLLYPLEQTFFRNIRDHYVYYQFFYQLGVFISRSSAHLVPINKLWYLVLAQSLTFTLLFFMSLHRIASNLYLTLFLMTFEGLFGGATYANAFRKINTELPPHLTEFSMGAASVADTLGITVAAFVSFFLEPAICNYQISIGFELCKAASNTG